MIDKNKLYGRYCRGEDAEAAHTEEERKLALKVAYKATDTPMEGDPVNVNTSRTGIGALGAVGIALAAGLPAALLAGLMLFSQSKPSVPVAQPGPADSNYTVRFFDKDGKLIDVPNISQRPTGKQP